MIQGFEEHTVELTEQEEKIALKMAAKLKLSVGKENAVTNERIQYFFGMNKVKIGSARIRKIIQYIRINSLVDNLCATSKGYFVAANQKELDDYILSLNQRLNAIELTLYSLQKKS